MRCTKVRKLIPRFVDSELEESTALLVRDHIASCAACRAEEAELRSTLDLLSEWPDANAKLGFEALLERASQRSRKAAERRAPLLGAPSWAVATLAAISLAGGALLGVTTTQTPSSPPPSEEQVASAMALGSFDDMLAASFACGIEADEAQDSQGVQQ